MSHPKPWTPKPVKPVDSRNRADLLLGQIGRLQAAKAKILADMDWEIAQIREHYRNKLDRIESAIHNRVQAIRAWADASPEAFGPGRSLQLQHGRIGFRLCPPSLRLLRGYNWDTVLARIEERRLPYVRVTKEIDKAGLIADADKLPLAELGLRISQRDEFFVEPNTETGQRTVVHQEAP